MPTDAGTITIPAVEIVKAGTWPASTGRITVTDDDIAAMVAAEADPEIRTGPIKLGHTGQLSKLGDSTPAFGYVTNLRASDDGATLIGDLTGIPAALETPIKEGFKQRSAEILWKVKTAAGNAYSAVLDAVALLGVQQPAVAGLADLAALYKPATVLSHLEAESSSALSLYDMPAAPDEPTHAERVVNELRWAKSAAANLAALTGIAGLDAVFAALDAMATPDSRGLLSQAPHSDPVPTPAPPGGQMPESTFKPEQLAEARTLLGLAADVTDEQVTEQLTKLSALVSTKPTETVVEAAAPSALSAATLDELAKAGLTILPTPALEQLQNDAKAGATAATHLATQQRDTVLDEAERAGKFGAGDGAKATRTNFAALLESDFAGAKAVIDSLPALVPVGEVGNSSTGPTPTTLSAAADTNWERYEDEVFGLDTEETA